MNLDVKGFKKISSDTKSTTLRHPDGHEIRIAHVSLSPKMKTQLQQLPQHFDDGGEVDDQSSIFDKKDDTPWYARNLDSYDPSSSDYKPSQKEMDEKAGDAAGQDIVKSLENQFVPEEASRSPAQDASIPEAHGANLNSIMYSAPPAPQGVPLATPQAVPAQVPSSPSVSSDPYGYGALAKGQLAGIGMQEQGLQQAAAAQQNLGLERQKAAEEHQVLLNKMQTDYQTKSAVLDKQINDTITDIKNNHIDPNHYLENMSTGKKIGTAIGLMLGGMGAAKTGGENPAQKFLNDQITRDINSQAQNLGKKENVLSAYYKQYGNLKDATDMARATQLGIYADKIDTAADKSMGPMAKAIALQQGGTLKQQKAQLTQQVAMRQSLMSGIKDPNTSPESKLRLMEMTGIVPKEDSAAAYKELQTAQNMSKQKDNLLGAFDQLTKLNTVGNRVMSPLQTPKAVDAIREPLLAQLVKDSEGRITPQDTEMIRSLFPAPGDDEKTNMLKKNQLNKFVSEKMNFPHLKALGIPYENGSRYGDSGQKKIQLGAPVR